MPRDVNQRAKATVRLVDVILGDADPEPEPPTKNPAAVQLGKLGGSKGGKRRAERMTPAERSEAARRAAQARWKK
jgi:hypothetical protein